MYSSLKCPKSILETLCIHFFILSHNGPKWKKSAIWVLVLLLYAGLPTSKAKIENPFIMFSHFPGHFIWNKNLENDDLRLNSFYTLQRKCPTAAIIMISQNLWNISLLYIFKIYYLGQMCNSFTIWYSPSEYR